MTATPAQVAHYQEQAIVLAAIKWHEAKTDAEVEAACEGLTKSVEAYVAHDRLWAIATREMRGAV